MPTSDSSLPSAYDHVHITLCQVFRHATGNQVNQCHLFDMVGSPGTKSVPSLARYLWRVYSKQTVKGWMSSNQYNTTEPTDMSSCT